MAGQKEKATKVQRSNNIASCVGRYGRREVWEAVSLPYPRITNNTQLAQPARRPLDLHRTPRTPRTAVVGTRTPPAHHTHSTAVAGTPGIPSRQSEPGVPPVAGWDRIHAAQVEDPGLATERRQARRHSRATSTAAMRVPGRARKRVARHPTRMTHRACGSRSASFGEAARRGTGPARRAIGAACVGACACMASCIQAWAPVPGLPCIMVDRSRARKACHARPTQRQVGLWVPTRWGRCMGMYIQVQARVVRKSFEGAEVGSARGARPLAQLQSVGRVQVQMQMVIRLSLVY